MNENELYVVKQYKFDNPLITEIDSIIDECFRGCPNNCFHNFEYECIYDIKITKITNNEINILTISAKSINLYELNEKVTVARQNGFLINQINKNNNKIPIKIRIYKHKLLSKVSNTDVS